MTKVPLKWGKISSDGKVEINGEDTSVFTSSSPALKVNGSIVANDLTGTTYESYLAWGNKNLSGAISPIDAGCIDEFGHNKLAYLPAECINVAYSTDGGSTWTDYGLTNDQKIALVTTTGNNIYAGKSATPTTETISNLHSRVRIASCTMAKVQKIYTALRKILINFTTSGTSNCKLRVRYRTIANYLSGTETWVTIGTYAVSGWSGWNSIPYLRNFGGNPNTQTGQDGEIELEFWAETVAATVTNKCALIDVRFIGVTNWATPSELARAGHLYTLDTTQNATFPAQVRTSATPSGNTDLTNKAYVDTKVSKSGDAISGNLTVNGSTSVKGLTTQAISASGDITCGNIIIKSSGSDGHVDSVAVGNDAYFGDCNIGGTIGVKGQNSSSHAAAGFHFYKGDNTAICGIRGYNGELQRVNANNSNAFKIIDNEDVSLGADGNKIAKRTSEGYLKATYFNGSSGVEKALFNGATSNIIFCNSDGYFRKLGVRDRVNTLYTGQLSSGSITFSYEHNVFVIRGDVVSGASTYYVNIPYNAIYTTGASYAFTNEANYVTFSMQRNDSTKQVTLTFTGRSSTGRILNVYAID